MTGQPTGTVTLLFSDIEGSTPLLAELGREAYARLLDAHRRLLMEAFDQHDGYVVGSEGDSFFVAFSAATGAVAAAWKAQAALAAFAWPDGCTVRVRMGLHTGEPLVVPSGYVGLEVHRAARVMSAAHGGQVLLTEPTARLVEGELPAGGVLRDLGQHRVRDFDGPVRLFQLGEQEFLPLRTATNTNLPLPASSFLGREVELEDAAVALLLSRLVTIVGPGGQGKTRFAVELARKLLDRRVGAYRDGIFFVSLAPIRDPALVFAEAATAIGAQGELASAVGDRHLLLVLDNFEHVIDAAPLVGRVLGDCPNLTMMVTSRELLRIDGERAFELGPLHARESVALFCDRAQVEPDDTVAELAKLLEGLPLAIELAAARHSVLSPAQLVARLSQRLDLLQGGRDADPRQQTLRATIEWSYDLLAAQEQELFMRLACFAGSCTLEAVEAVVAADLDTLQSLVDKSLVRRRADRYWMLETIREYAAERLEASRQSRDLACRHAEYFLFVAAQLAPLLEHSGGPRTSEALTTIDDELPNFRNARSTLMELGQPADALRLGLALWRYWMARDVAQGRDWVEAPLAAAGDVDPSTRARAHEARGVFAALEGDPARGIELSEKSLALYEALTDTRGMREVLNNLGMMRYHVGDRDEGRALLQRSADLSRLAGDEALLALARGNLAEVAFRDGDLDRAGALARDVVGSWIDLGDEVRAAGTLTLLGEVLRLQSDPDGALEAFARAAQGWQSIVQVDHVPVALAGIALVTFDRGDRAWAARLLGAAQAILAARGVPLDEAVWSPDLVRQTVEAIMSDAALGQDLAAGRELNVEDAVSYALETVDLLTTRPG